MTWLFEGCSIPTQCVKIHIAPNCRGDVRRVELSSGTRLANDPENPHRFYDDGAYVPRGPWRLPTEKESSSLFSDSSPKDPGRSVSIIRPPGLCFGERVGRSRLLHRDDIKRLVFESARRVCDISEDATPIGPIVNPSNLETTTVGADGKKYIGLHVDSWESADLGRRDCLKNRICVNLGMDPRYFLFIPIPVVEIARVMRKEIGRENIPVENPSALGRMFMSRFPKAPVIRCRVAPNEAYVAPTDHLIHDASSEGSIHLDEQFTILGRIFVHAFLGE
jgi:hypothetical protein